MEAASLCRFVRFVRAILKELKNVAIKLDVDSNLRFHFFTKRLRVPLQESAPPSLIAARFERFVRIHSAADFFIVVSLSYS